MTEPSRRLRPELPPIPERMRGLPIDRRGYPVPYFVAWVDGVPNFTVIDAEKRVRCHVKKICWVCGFPLGAWHTFAIGPMCAVTRTTAEPGSHLGCAEFSAKACPFLVRPAMHRNDAAVPEDGRPPGGVMLRRNPGVVCLWSQRGPATRWNPGPKRDDWLLRLNDPGHVEWYREARRATREEAWASIREGLPPLLDMAENDDDRAELGRRVQAAMPLLPAAEKETTP